MQTNVQNALITICRSMTQVFDYTAIHGVKKADCLSFAYFFNRCWSLLLQPCKYESIYILLWAVMSIGLKMFIYYVNVISLKI